MGGQQQHQGHGGGAEGAEGEGDAGRDGEGQELHLDHHQDRLPLALLALLKAQLGLWLSQQE